MNAESSRSHLMLTIYVDSISYIDDDKIVKTGKLNLVDLAGSERIAKTGAIGQTLVEAMKINLSLSSLGNVIMSLCANSKVIPYRDSKLTQLLRDSLGGNSFTQMIACISPAEDNYDETMSTLRFASNAKKIKNKPTVNLNDKDAQILKLKEEIKQLKQLKSTNCCEDKDETKWE